MKKKWIALLLAGIMACNMWMPATVHAEGDDTLEGDTGLEEIPGGDWDSMIEGKSGTCGTSSTWIFSDDGTLTIGGSGAVSDSSGYSKYKSNIKALVIGDKITEIGNNSFDGYTAIKGTVTLPSSVKKIGSAAFNGTTGISKIVISNADCEIADGANTFSSSTTLSAAADSTAKDYAVKYDRKFECTSHKYGEWTTVKEPTCTEAGSKKQVCSGCGVEQTQSVSAKGHSWEANPTVDKEATCTTEGKESVHCSVCSATKNEETIAALGHKYADTLSKDDTNHWSECSVCHDKKDVTAHTYTDDKCQACGHERAHTHKLALVAAVDATCDKAGNKAYYTCSGCDSWFEDANGTTVITDKNSVKVDSLGHSFTKYESDNNATCTADGTKTAKCDRCTATDTVADAGSALNHSFTKYESDGNATCTADGTKTAKCDRCTATDTVADTGSAKGHSYSETWSKDADNHWKECGNCHGKTDTAAHTYNTDDTCDICGYERAHVHNLTAVAAVDATCTTDGSKAYYTCAGCDSIFEDANGTTVIVDKNSLVVKALGHSYTNYTSDGNTTCTADGTKTAKCDRCSVTNTVTDTGSAKGHSMKYTEAVDATCTADGSKAYYTCTVCEKTFEDSKGNKEITDKDSLIVQAAGHNYADTWSKDANNHWKECSVCYEKKSAEAHTYNGDTCSVCGYEKAHVHSLEAVAEVKATCTKSGNTSYYKCSGCDSWFEDAEGTKAITDKTSVIVNALGHDYNADGNCNRCGQRNPELPDTMPSEIAFTQDKVTVDYTGNPVEDVMNYVKITKGEGELIFTYYLDEACTIPTYEGTVDEGNAPSDPGKYYVKVSITAYEHYEAADAEGMCILTVRPRKVTGAKAVNNKSTIKLTWKKCKEADGYIIYRRKKGTSTSAYKAIETITDNTTLSYSDGNIKQGSAYIYTIRAYADAADGTRVNGLMMSSAVKIVRTKVTSITNLNGSVKIKWTKVDGADGYKVYRKTSGEDKYTRIQTITNGNTNYYVDKANKAIKNCKASYYYVKPYFEEDESWELATNKKTNYYVTRSTISSVTGAKKAITVKWKKNTSASGYQIRYSKSKSFDDYETITVNSKNTVSKKISNLSATKTYYVKVRTYKTYNGVKYYSAWSTVKNGKTK